MDARAAMKAWSPGTPAPPTRAKSADPQWTPGEMYELESQLSDGESDVDPDSVSVVGSSSVSYVLSPVPS